MHGGGKGLRGGGDSGTAVKAQALNVDRLGLNSTAASSTTSPPESLVICTGG